MTEVYLDCQSYRDSGSVDTLFITDDGERLDKRPFTTAFVRTKAFRFEFERTKLTGRKWRYIIWSDGERVKKWWDLHSEIEEPESLEMAVAAAFGVSGTSSGWVPRLLSLERFLECALKEPVRIEDGNFSETACYRIEAMYAKSPLIVWIEKGTYLLRRIEKKHRFEDFCTETTINYYPEINEEVTEQMLVFAPPIQR
jgi:hypothetical protein